MIHIPHYLQLEVNSTLSTVFQNTPSRTNESQSVPIVPLEQTLVVSILKNSRPMHLPHMLIALVSPCESLAADAVAPKHSARVLTSGMTLQVTLHLILTIEQLRRRAAGDTTLKYFASLTARWDGGDGRTDDDGLSGGVKVGVGTHAAEGRWPVRSLLYGSGSMDVRDIFGRR